MSDPKTLYIELMKKVVSYSLWPEPGIPMEYLIHNYSLKYRIIFSLINRLFKNSNFKLVLAPSDIRQRDIGRIWPKYGHTMIGLKRLDNIEYCVKEVLKNNVEGDLIETGVWRGGASIFMRAILIAYGVKDRRVFVADSFKGLPNADIEKYPQDRGMKLDEIKYLAVSRNEVESNFANYGLLDEQVVFLEGWFKDTLPNAPIDKLAVMRLDGDMYESTINALDNLYPKLSKGGFCIIDDYYMVPSCRMAVDEFRRRENIQIPLIQIDEDVAFWQK